MRGQVGGEQLGEVAPLRREDHGERGGRGTAGAGRRHRRWLRVLLAPALADRLCGHKTGSGQEDHGHHGIHDLRREQVKHDRAQRRGDHHVHHEGTGRAEPDLEGPAPGGHHQ